MSDSDEKMEFNVKGLDRLIKALGADMPTIRVGILGKGGARNSSKGSTASNAEIGMYHEFGTTELPQRSFLRMPLAEKLDKEMESSGAISEETMKEVIKSGTIMPWAQKIAGLAVSIVLRAFQSGGFGKWKPSNMTHKKNGQTLIETRQLANSITSEVKDAS